MSRLNVEREVRTKVAGATLDALRQSGSWLHPIEAAEDATPGWLRIAAHAGHSTIEHLRPYGVRRSYPIPLPLHEEMKPILDKPFDHSGATALAGSLVTLPSHWGVGARDITRMVNAIREKGH